MTNDDFLQALHLRSYLDQIGGYMPGDPARQNFKEIVPVMGTPPNIDREKTLALPCYSGFTAEERERMLAL